jgi:hypothetical protein
MAPPEIFAIVKNAVMTKNAFMTIAAFAFGFFTLRFAARD